jgi:peptidoglycan/LPS O-acetylase OafA/YrhL
MSTSSSRISESRLPTAVDFIRGAARLLWHAIRLPVLVFLVILEPVVRLVLGALALLGVLVALFFKAYGVPHFPFLLMLGVSVGLGLILAGYEALLDLLGRVRQ